jgi:hypothetical protein
VCDQPYRILSPTRLAKRGRRTQPTNNKIDYITGHRAKEVPSDDSES